MWKEEVDATGATGKIKVEVIVVEVVGGMRAQETETKSRGQVLQDFLVETETPVITTGEGLKKNQKVEAG